MRNGEREEGGTAVLPTAHRMHSACVVTNYLEDRHCRSSISPQNALYPDQSGER